MPLVRSQGNQQLDESYMVIPLQQPMASFAEELNASNGSTNRSLVRQNATCTSPELNRTAGNPEEVGTPGPNVQRMIEALTERMNSMEQSFNSKK